MSSKDLAEIEAVELMLGFAERTGLHGDTPPQRYLWTDAYAVCNFLTLKRTTGESRYLELALRLVDQVHHVLGRYRPDDARSGWLSGLDEVEGEAHPTRGGLRIGKKLKERAESEPFDDRLEWDRDGQYFHYLTKWMQALDRVAHATKDARFNLWARELAQAAHAAFVYGLPQRGGRRMMWKMSTDLKRPLVPAMGYHDALDGFITSVALQASAAQYDHAAYDHTAPGPNLAYAIADFATMLDGRAWVTADPLGLGGLLSDASRVAELLHEPAMSSCPGLLQILLDASLRGLRDYVRHNDLHQPASHRLAFRELGVVIGLSAIERTIKRWPMDAPGSAESVQVGAQLQALVPYLALGSIVISFWLAPEHRQGSTWLEHRDINEVMLATSLLLPS
jgi:hypothetical protein